MKAKMRYAALGLGAVGLIAWSLETARPEKARAPAAPASEQTVEANIEQPIQDGSSSPSAGAPAQTAAAARLALVRDVVASGGDPHAKELLSALEKERRHYEDLAREYDELNARYREHVLTGTPESTLRAEGGELDACMRQLQAASGEVYRASAQLSDVLVANALTYTAHGAKREAHSR